MTLSAAAAVQPLAAALTLQTISESSGVARTWRDKAAQSDKTRPELN